MTPKSPVLKISEKDFYLTDLRHQAEAISGKNSENVQGVPTLTTLEFDLEKML